MKKGFREKSREPFLRSKIGDESCGKGQVSSKCRREVSDNKILYGKESIEYYVIKVI